MRKIITLMLLVSMAMLPVSDAAVVFSLSKPYVAPVAPSTTYVPAYAKVPCGGASSGNKFKVVLYDGSRNIIANGESAEGTNVEGEVTVNFTNCDALTAGSLYYLSIKQNNYQNWKTVSGAFYEAAVTYASAGPATLATGSSTSGNQVTIQIYNSSNQLLIGDAVQATTNEYTQGSGGQIIFYKGSRYTCNTL